MSLTEEVVEWTCTLCGEKTLSWGAAMQHLADTEDDAHALEVILQAPEWGDDRGRCGLCGKESTLSGLDQHCRDKYNHPTDLPHLVVDSAETAETDLPVETESMFYCPKCGRTAATVDTLESHECVSLESANTRLQSLFPTSENGDSSPSESSAPSLSHPDVVANRLLENEGDPVRIHLKDAELTIPTEPYQSGTPETETVPARAFDAVVDRCYNEDAGLSISGRLHLPESEWERLGLGKHWEAEDAQTAGHQRHLELWASREKSMESSGYKEDLYRVPPSVGDDAPILEPYREYEDNERVPDSPISPLEPTKLTLWVAHAQGSSDGRGLDRLDVGRIARVEPLPELDEEPEQREETRDSGESPPSSQSRYPTIDYDDMEPLPATDEVLDALYTINRVAKRHGEQGDEAYRRNDGALAKVHSVKKHALYDAKTIALHRLAAPHPDSLTLTRHKLNDDHDHWLFDFGTRSFHQPARAVANELLEDYGFDTEDEDATSIEYDSNPGSRDLPLSVEEALGHLLEYGIDANEYLSQTSVAEYEWGFVQATHDTRWQIPEPTSNDDGPVPPEN